jgi:hypothetical protein
MLKIETRFGKCCKQHKAVLKGISAFINANKNRVSVFFDFL